MRKKAQQVANEWEKAARLAAERRLGEAQARRVISDIYAAVSNEPLLSAVAKDFLSEWTEKRKADAALRTYQAYKHVARDFIKSVEERANVDISQPTKTDVAKYRDGVLKRTSVANANKSLKYLRIAFNAAYKDGVAQDNPAANSTSSSAAKQRTETSLLKNAGVPEAVAKDIIGHDSEAISHHYIHIETKTKRAALKKSRNIL